MKNADFNTHDVRRCCENKLGITFRKGKEQNGWYWLVAVSGVRSLDVEVVVGTGLGRLKMEGRGDGSFHAVDWFGWIVARQD